MFAADYEAGHTLIAVAELLNCGKSVDDANPPLALRIGTRPLPGKANNYAPVSE